MNEPKYGLLLNNNAKLHRGYFNEMVSLIGVQVIYRSPKKDKHWTTYAEIDSNYNPPIIVGCIFDEHPTIKTLKKMGWVSELQPNSSIIHVPYDTPNLQVGALFIIPSGIDNTKGRVFRVVSMETIFVYPASVALEIVPEYENDFNDSLLNHKNNSFNLLTEEEDNL
jgi:hypothetical protein